MPSPLRDRMLDVAGGIAGAEPARSSADGVRVGERLLGFAEIVRCRPGRVAHRRGHHRPTAASTATQRSLAFNVHAFRVAVDLATGEVRILQSVQAADAGIVMNPEQCRGQVEGGVAQGIGSALYEEVHARRRGHGREPGRSAPTTCRRSPTCPSPRSTSPTRSDDLGPLGAKSMSESPYNPVAPALANAIARALGIRPYEQPFSRDRLWRLVHDDPAEEQH